MARKHTDSWQRLTFPNATWLVAPHWRYLLFDEKGFRWHNHTYPGNVSIVKHTPHRTIYRIQLTNNDHEGTVPSPQLISVHKYIYCKCYPLQGVRGWAERLNFSDKARQECEKSFFLLELGILTPEPIACGRDHQAAYVVTAGIENVMALDYWLTTVYPKLPQGERERFRLHLPRLLAKTIAAFHRVGIYHADLYAGNFLIRYHPGREPELFVTDTHEVSCGRALSWRRSCQNLAMFGSWFVERTHAVDRHRFFVYYTRYRADWQVSREQQRRWAREAEQRAWRSLLGFYRRRETRLWHNPRYFYKWRSDTLSKESSRSMSWRAWAVREFSVDALQQLIAEAETILPKVEKYSQKPAGETCQRSMLGSCGDGSASAGSGVEQHVPRFGNALRQWHDRGRRGGFWETVIEVGGQHKKVVVKAFRLSTWRQRLAEQFYLGPASRSWYNAHRLRHQGFNTPHAFALLHSRRGFLPDWALLVCEKRENTLNLRDALVYVQKHCTYSWAEKLSRWIRALACYIARLHRHGFSHRDLKAAHFLVNSSDIVANASECNLCLIDLVGLSLPIYLSRRRCAQNLARLQASFAFESSISRTDRLRFLRAYLRGSGRSTKEWKWWWRHIARSSERKIMRNHRLGRPLT